MNFGQYIEHRLAELDQQGIAYIVNDMHVVKHHPYFLVLKDPLDDETEIFINLQTATEIKLDLLT